MIDSDYHFIKISAGDDFGMLLRSNYTCFGKHGNDESLCSGNGLCVGVDKCSCVSNYFGDACELTKCFDIISNASNVCSGNGNCSDSNVCECKTNYDGNECQYFFSEANQNVLYSFGYNGYGDLGQNQTDTKNGVPTRIFGHYPGAKNVFGGKENNAFILTNTTSYGFGKNLVSKLFLVIIKF